MIPVGAGNVQRCAPIVQGLIDVAFVLEEQPHDVQTSLQASNEQRAGPIGHGPLINVAFVLEEQPYNAKMSFGARNLPRTTAKGLW